MPISGPVVHQQLMDAYAKAQAQLDSIRGQSNPTQAERETLNESRGEALVGLAKHYLPELTVDSIRNTWDELRPSLSRVLEKKTKSSQRVQSQLAQLREVRAQQDQTLLQLSEQLDDAVNDQQQVSDQVESRLKEDPEFGKLSDRAAMAEAALERAESNLHEIDQDSAKKLPAYKQSKLFEYLRERKFGTPEYKHRGLTRRMDRWVAKLVDYTKSKQSYDFLRKTPEQMRKIIAEDRQALDVVMQELERRRDRVADEFGLPAKVETATQIKQQRESHLAAIQKSTAEFSHLQEQMSQIADPRGPYYDEAISIFRNLLQKIDSRDLSRRAKSTIDIADDQMVDQLKVIESKLGSLDDREHQHQNEIAKTQHFMNGLGGTIQRFRSAGFDSSRSQFVGTLDVFDVLARAWELNDVDMLWQELRRCQRWGPTTMEKVQNVAAHPMTQILINAMAHAAGGALAEHARRAGGRGRGRGGYRW